MSYNEEKTIRIQEFDGKIVAHIPRALLSSAYTSHQRHVIVDELLANGFGLRPHTPLQYEPFKGNYYCECVWL